MWQALDKISEQVTRYSTCLGQLWYLCVFLFRLIVVATIGGAVYGDEQSAFTCNTKQVGCTQNCFNVFSKISHIRFWAFQLLAVTTPTVLFHFYSMNVTGQIEKLKRDEEKIRKMEEGEVELTIAEDPELEKDIKRVSKRKKSIGNVRVKKIYSGGDVEEIPLTLKIHVAYFLSVVLRVVLEGLFIYLAYQLFRFTDVTNTVHWSGLDFLWFKVPAMYTCTGDGYPEVKNACYQHLGFSKTGSVPCWVSRPWEKTIFVRYMNVLSALCFLLCLTELAYLTLKAVCGTRPRRRPRFFSRKVKRRNSVFYPNVTLDHHMEQQQFYPSLAVPVRLGDKFLRNGIATPAKVQISEKGEVTDDLDLWSMTSARS